MEGRRCSIVGALLLHCAAQRAGRCAHARRPSPPISINSLGWAACEAISLLRDTMNEFFYSPHKKQLQQQKSVRAEGTFLLQPDHSAFSAPVFVLYMNMWIRIFPPTPTTTTHPPPPPPPPGGLSPVGTQSHLILLHDRRRWGLSPC